MRADRSWLLLVASITVLLPMSAADRGFDGLVDAIEAHYGIHRTHIPLLGLANIVLKVKHPAGASGFKLALFENLQDCEKCFDGEELDRFIDEAAGRILHPLVRVHTDGGRQATYILTGEIGRSTQMLIATFDRSEATVVEVTVDLRTLLKTLNSPDKANEWFGPTRQRDM